MSSDRLTPKEKRIWDEWVENGKRLKNATVSTLNETEKQKTKRIKYLLNPKNFDKFIDFYFKTGDFKPAPLGWFHWEAVKNIFIKKKRKHIWEWHRESAKSVFGDIFVPIHKLCSEDLTGMILASETEDKAKNLIKDVEQQLRYNQRLINDFGNFRITGSWLQGYFQTNTGIGFWAFGIGQNPAGVRNGFKRPNLGIVDDADNKDKAKNQKLTKGRVDWIKGEFMGCLAKDDRCFIYINNRIDKYGITAHMVGDIEEDDIKDVSYAHIKVALTENPETHEVIEPDGYIEADILADLIAKGAVPAWDEYYSLEDCAAKIADYGYRNAMRQLYHVHVEDGDYFSDANMPWVEPLMLQEYDSLATYCDPAFGESGKGSYKAIVLIGKKGHYYDVLWIWCRQKGNWLKQHRFIAENVHEIEQLPVDPKEGKALQKGMPNWCEANPLQKTELRKSYQLENLKADTPWFPRYDEAKKPDKIGRIENLEPLANLGYLRFNIRFKGTKDMTKAREQFKGFPNGNIDAPDAICDGIEKANKASRSGKRKWSVGQFIKSNGRQW